MQWIFLRGWTREVRHWMDFPQKFERALPGHFVHCLELPGFGNSPYQKSPTSITKIQSLLREDFLKLKNQNPTEQFGILGISLGGMVTSAWITEYPSDFKKAVVINSSAKNLSSLNERLQMKSLVKLLSVIKEADQSKREEIILSVVSHCHRKPPYSIGLIPFGNAFRQLVAASRFQLKAENQVSALVLASETDQILKFSACKRLAEKLNATLRSHPTAGHDLPLDDPDWCIQEISRWIKDS